MSAMEDLFFKYLETETISRSDAYKQADDKIYEIYKTLDDKHKKIFEDIFELHSEMMSEAEFTLFKYGFKFGLTLAMETVLSD